MSAEDIYSDRSSLVLLSLSLVFLFHFQFLLSHVLLAPPHNI